ncbi:MAG: BamA/TamA family outer membrane protein [Prevotella sp.]|nr:BamA/TamA family outer membrane protein [Prevotella sp.]
MQILSIFKFVLKKNVLCLMFLLSMMAVSCSTSKYVPEGEYLLDKVDVKSDSKDFDVSILKPYLKQKTNTKLFPTIKYKLGSKFFNDKDSAKWIDKAKIKWGNKPIFFDSVQAENTCNVLKSVMNNNGYLHAKVDYITKINNKRLKLKYLVHPDKLFFIDKISYVISDSSIKTLLIDNDFFKRGLRKGIPFSVEDLDTERQRITSFLRSNGYYKFNKEFIHYDCDTISGSQLINIVLYLDLFQNNYDDAPKEHLQYKIRKITYSFEPGTTIRVRQPVLENSMMLSEGGNFSAEKLQQTYNNFSRLHAIKYTNIKLNEIADSAMLDVHVHVKTNKPSSISFQPEGTNTAGNLGAAAILTYENRNLFRGSETLSMQIRAAFEAITGLEGYQNKNYEEYNIETRLSFPRFLIPFIPTRHKIHVNATSELALSYNLQNRPEFHRRVFSSVWRYRWHLSKKKVSYKLDLIDLNYIYMPWISSTFKSQYLDDVSSRNAILRYNYEDLFIAKIGFGVSYSNKRQVVRASVETSGNFLNAMSNFIKMKRNSQGQYTVLNIAYAQYAKGDFEYSYALPFSRNSTFVMHAGFGIAYPYGNSKILPFEKRYFSGGANSVRGWNVRGLGPGKYHKSNGAIDFINQTGDIKIDLNLEYRMRLFWKINGAVFIDAGNIWTLRNYEEQPGGQFYFNEFYKQMAVAYGLGLRLNFDYFILRFDLGMKAINPAYKNSKEHYPIFHPDVSRDFAFHFAVGLPF